MKLELLGITGEDFIHICCQKPTKLLTGLHALGYKMTVAFFGLENLHISLLLDKCSSCFSNLLYVLFNCILDIFLLIVSLIVIRGHFVQCRTADDMLVLSLDTLCTHNSPTCRHLTASSMFARIRKRLIDQFKLFILNP